jgi:hypothetical protein
VLTIHETRNIHDINSVRKELVTEFPIPPLSEGIETDILHAGIVVKRLGEPVGVACLYKPKDMIWSNKTVWTLGNFEMRHDEEAAKLLFGVAKRITKAHGGQMLVGPMNGNTMNHYRLRDQDTEQVPPFFSERSHPAYYHDLFDANFPERLHYYSALDRRMDDSRPEDLSKLNHFQNLGLKFRSIDLENFDHELERMYDFNNVAFSKNAFFTTLNKEAFIAKYREAKQLISDDFTTIAESANGEIVGFSFCFPNLYNSEEKQLVMKTVARHPDPEWAGLGSLLTNRIFSRARKLGYTSAIHAFMARSGTSAPVSQRLKAGDYATYTLYATFTQ